MLTAGKSDMSIKSELKNRVSAILFCNWTDHHRIYSNAAWTHDPSSRSPNNHTVKWRSRLSTPLTVGVSWFARMHFRLPGFDVTVSCCRWHKELFGNPIWAAKVSSVRSICRNLIWIASRISSKCGLDLICKNGMVSRLNKINQDTI